MLSIWRNGNLSYGIRLGRFERSNLFSSGEVPEFNVVVTAVSAIQNVEYEFAIRRKNSGNNTLPVLGRGYGTHDVRAWEPLYDFSRLNIPNPNGSVL